MIGRARRVVDLASGRFTPFLDAGWTEQEHRLLAAWRAGASLEGAAGSLAARLAESFGDRATVTLTSSGRSAIRLALESLDLPPGSGVALPSYACTGVIAPVIAAGLRPVYADVTEDLNVDVQTVAELADDVRAVILPHLGGRYADGTREIIAWAGERGIALVEDHAQSMGLDLVAAQRDVPRIVVGSVGPGKPLFGPAGGFIATTDSGIAERVSARELAKELPAVAEARLEAFVDRYVRPLRARGRDAARAFVRDRIGFAPRTIAAPPPDPQPHTPSELEASLALLALDRLPAQIDARRRNGNRWRGLLAASGHGGLRLASAEGNTHLKLWCRGETEAGRALAAQLRQTLARHGVETEPLYTPLHLRPGFPEASGDVLAMTERVWRGVYSLPCRASLTDDDWRRIEAALETSASRARR